MAAGQLSSRGHALTGMKPRHPFTDLNDPRTELMPKQLNRGLGFELFLDLFVRQSWNTAGELSFRDAWLNAEDFRHHMCRPADRCGDVIQPHVVESVKPPSPHSLTSGWMYRDSRGTANIHLNAWTCNPPYRAI